MPHLDATPLTTGSPGAPGLGPSRLGTPRTTSLGLHTELPIWLENWRALTREQHSETPNTKNNRRGALRGWSREAELGRGTLRWG